MSECQLLKVLLNSALLCCSGILIVDFYYKSFIIKSIAQSIAQSIYQLEDLATMITIFEVAQKAGVSSTTVSHVINKTRFVSDETRGRVERAIEEMGYRPNALARSLRSGETHTIGLILPDSANPFFAEVGRSIEGAAFDVGYNIILCNTENNIEKEHTYIDVLAKKQVDGMIFVGAGEDYDSYKKILDMKIRVVAMDRDYPDLEMDVVISDNLQGGKLATQHLIDLGHKRIGCITGPSKVNLSALRVTGYVETLEQAGLPVDQSLIVTGDFHPESGQEAAYKLLAMKDPPTAIFACNDLMAIGVMRACIELGMRIPQDLAVVGYDDIELASYSTPPLTTIQQPKKEMGITALKYLLGRIQAEQSPPQRASLPVSLIVRGSSC
jgi:LacI family transcriptional regulator